MSHGLDGHDEVEDEELELEDDSVNDGDPSDQTRPPVRVRLLLALAGTGVLKQGLRASGSGRFSVRFLGLTAKNPTGREVLKPEKESSTK